MYFFFITAHVSKVKKRPLVRLRRVKDRPRVDRLRSRQSDHADFFALTKSRTSSSDIYGSESFPRKKSRTTKPESTETEVLWNLGKRKKCNGSNLTRAVPVHKNHREIKSSTTAKITKQSQVWAYKYGPGKVSELATHPKKLSEVKQWMTTALSDKQPTWSPHKLLILQGPAGIGKSTMALLLAKELGATVRQWKGRRSQASNGFTRRGRSSFGGLHEFPTKYTNELDEFREFLFQSNRYRGLLLQKSSMATGMSSKKTLRPRAKSKELIMIDAIPYLRNDNSKDDFMGILERFMQTTMFPAVMVFTETIEAGHGPGKEVGGTFCVCWWCMRTIYKTLKKSTFLCISSTRNEYLVFSPHTHIRRPIPPGRSSTTTRASSFLLLSWTPRARVVSPWTLLHTRSWSMHWSVYWNVTERREVSVWFFLW